MKDLEEKLAKAPENKGKLIITDGVFSMSAKLQNFLKSLSLAKKYEARVMVDDAHGFRCDGCLWARNCLNILD